MFRVWVSCGGFWYAVLSYWLFSVCGLGWVFACLVWPFDCLAGRWLAVDCGLGWWLGCRLLGVAGWTWFCVGFGLFRFAGWTIWLLFMVCLLVWGCDW